MPSLVYYVDLIDLLMIPLSNIVELLVVYCVNILCVVLVVRTYDVILLFVL